MQDTGAYLAAMTSFTGLHEHSLGLIIRHSAQVIFLPPYGRFFIIIILFYSPILIHSPGGLSF